MREDVLIGRVVDGEASRDDWAELESAAAGDPGVWARLALAQRDHACLSAVVEDRIAVAELSELRPHRRDVVGTIWRSSGWLIAACLAVVMGAAWLSGARTAEPWTPTPTGVTRAGLTAASYGQQRDDAIAQGLREGVVFRVEQPKLVGYRPGDGSEEFDFFVRRSVVERIRSAEVSKLRVLESEHGEPVVVKSQPAAFISDRPM